MSDGRAGASNTVLQGVERPAYRADHVGSFLRPPGLLEAAAAGDPRLHELEDAAILDVIAVQREVGVDVYSDGEFRRTWFAGAWRNAVEGLVPAEPPAFMRRGWRGA